MHSYKQSAIVHMDHTTEGADVFTDLSIAFDNDNHKIPFYHNLQRPYLILSLTST